MAELTDRQKAIRAILSEFAIGHIRRGPEQHPAGYVYFDDSTDAEEIELLAHRIVGANEIPDEPAEEHHAKDVHRALFASIGSFAPILAGVYTARHLRGMVDALKKSAEADVMRTLIECEHFLIGNEQVTGEQVDAWKRVKVYADRLRHLQACFAAEAEESEEPTLREALKMLAGCNVVRSEFDDAFTIYLTGAHFEELAKAVEKAGGDVTYWRDHFLASRKDEAD